MSKATKLRTKAQNKHLVKLIDKKLNSKPQTVKTVTDTTLSNGEKGKTITFDIFK